MPTRKSRCRAFPRRSDVAGGENFTKASGLENRHVSDNDDAAPRSGSRSCPARIHHLASRTQPCGSRSARRAPSTASSGPSWRSSARSAHLVGQYMLVRLRDDEGAPVSAKRASPAFGAGKPRRAIAYPARAARRSSTRRPVRPRMDHASHGPGGRMATVSPRPRSRWPCSTCRARFWASPSINRWAARPTSAAKLPIPGSA